MDWWRITDKGVVSLPYSYFNEWGLIFSFIIVPVSQPPSSALCSQLIAEATQLHIQTPLWIHRLKAPVFIPIVGGSWRDQFVFLGPQVWIGKVLQQWSGLVDTHLHQESHLVVLFPGQSPFAILASLQWILLGSSLGEVLCLSPFRAQWFLPPISTAPICSLCAEGLQSILPLSRAFTYSFPIGRNKMSLGKAWIYREARFNWQEAAQGKNMFVYTTHLGTAVSWMTL